MAKIIAIVNQKGGVGKTTTAINLSAGLGMHHKKTLLVDIDPQGNATTGVGIMKEELSSTMYEVFLSEVALEDIILNHVYENVDVAPSSLYLSAVEMNLIDQHKDQNNILKNQFMLITDFYDYIIIDCPPSLGLVNRNALACADSVLIPVQVEYYALEGLTQLLKSIHFVQRLTNPQLTIEGVLMTMFDRRTNLSFEISAELKKYFANKLYQTYIPRTIKLGECPAHGEHIFKYDRYGAGAEAYRNLVREVLYANE